MLLGADSAPMEHFCKLNIIGTVVEVAMHTGSVAFDAKCMALDMVSRILFSEDISFETRKTLLRAMNPLFRDSRRLEPGLIPVLQGIIGGVMTFLGSDASLIGCFEEESGGLTVLEAVISGFLVLESDTLALSGAALIQLLELDGPRLSQSLSRHADFPDILAAALSVMYTQLIDSQLATPFIRMVRFCEWLMDLTVGSEFPSRLVSSVKSNFVKRILRSSSNRRSFQDGDYAKYQEFCCQWALEMVRVCQRGNVLVAMILEEVFLSWPTTSTALLPWDVLASERSQTIGSLKRLLISHHNASDDDDVPMKGMHVADESKMEKTRTVRSEAIYSELAQLFPKLFEDDAKGLDPYYRSLLQHYLNASGAKTADSDCAWTLAAKTALQRSWCQDDRMVTALLNWLPHCAHLFDVGKGLFDGKVSDVSSLEEAVQDNRFRFLMALAAADQVAVYNSVK